MLDGMGGSLHHHGELGVNNVFSYFAVTCGVVQIGSRCLVFVTLFCGSQVALIMMAFDIV